MKRIYLRTAIILMAAFLCGCGHDGKEEGKNHTEVQATDGSGQEDAVSEGQEAEKRKEGEPLKIDNQGMPEDLLNGLLKSLVHIQTPALSGSGFIWEFEEDMVIVTAAHVLENASSFAVTLPDGYTLSADLYWVCEHSDLAFLFIKGERIPKLHLEYYRTIDKKTENFNKIQSGELLYAIGHTGPTEALTVTGSLEDKWIFVEDFEQFMVLAEMEIQNGMSGGALLDAEGYCMGILCGMDGEGQVVAVPYQVIEAELLSIHWE